MAISIDNDALELHLVELSKRFNKNLLFKQLNIVCKSGETLAITGANGSGKSTLLKIIAGLIPPNAGNIKILHRAEEVDKEKYYSYINICAPYIYLIENFTLSEHLAFHSKFKKPITNEALQEALTMSGLSSASDTLVSDFSSGMKQRLKLILALCFQGPILLLDEPTAHLDASGKNWYRTLLKKRINNSITLIFSNEENEYLSFTQNLIDISTLKN